MKPFSFVALTVVAVIPNTCGQSSDARTSLQQALNSQFTPTKVSTDKKDIVAAGTVLVLQKDGLIMYSTASPLAPLITWKNGKMSKSFAEDLAISLALKGGGTVDSLPKRTFVAGEKAWFAGFTFAKDGIALLLYSDPYDDVRYYTFLKFQFDKKSVPTSDEALAKISEVLAVQPAETSDKAPEAGVLQNDDIIKMAKAALDDSIIIAKIKSSKCQFDTTPDTLIQLKQSGVSSAVLKAMAEVSSQP